MQKFFLKHCKIYRKFVDRVWGLQDVHTLQIPSEFYGDFNVHYLCYDKNGNVTKGFKTLWSALRGKGELGLTVLYDKY